MTKQSGKNVVGTEAWGLKRLDDSFCANAYPSRELAESWAWRGDNLRVIKVLITPLPRTVKKDVK